MVYFLSSVMACFWLTTMYFLYLTLSELPSTSYLVIKHFFSLTNAAGFVLIVSLALMHYS